MGVLQVRTGRAWARTTAGAAAMIVRHSDHQRSAGVHSAPGVWLCLRIWAPVPVG